MSPPRIAFFISPHGFGHAARATAVMEAIHHFLPEARFEIFTRVPQWFFDFNLTGLYNYHPFLTDIGLSQDGPLQEDLPGTLHLLAELVPFDRQVVADLAREVNLSGCGLVVCDIAPLGIAVAQAAGVPSVLVENFTWDWIYEGYLDQEPGFKPFITYLHERFTEASHHIQTQPVCAYWDAANLLVGPISRTPRHDAAWVRERLGIPPGSKPVLVTMGGVVASPDFLKQLPSAPGIVFVVAGGSSVVERSGSNILLPHHSEFYHPDLVHACDAVVGKAGYSTLAETYHAGVPFAFISRHGFREADVLASFIHREMDGFEIPQEAFLEGSWIASLLELLGKPRRTGRPNAARQVAKMLSHIL